MSLCKIFILAGEEYNLVPKIFLKMRFNSISNVFCLTNIDGWFARLGVCAC